MELYEWIRKQTEGMKTAVEMGCGFGNNLADIRCETRIGIDIFKPYLEMDKSDGAILIHGDATDLTRLPAFDRPAVALLVDVIEHIEKPDALIWLYDLKATFDRIAVQTPFGFHVQTEDYYRMGGDIHQKHRSGWSPEDFASRGFKVEVVKDYHIMQLHKGSPDAIFAVWDV